MSSEYDDLGYSPPKAQVDDMLEMAARKETRNRTQQQWMDIFLGRYRARYSWVKSLCAGIKNHDAIDLVMRSLDQAKKDTLFEDIQAWSEDRNRDSRQAEAVAKAVAEERKEMMVMFVEEQDKNREVLDKALEQSKLDREQMVQMQVSVGDLTGTVKDLLKAVTENIRLSHEKSKDQPQPEGG